MLKLAAKSLMRYFGWYERASRAWMWAEPRLTNSVRAVTRKNARLIDQYLAAHQLRGLHVGCGGNHLDRWLNTELCPRGDEIFLDATRGFPLPSQSFDYVYSEHMIEHIPYTAAVQMLRECHRVLRAGGVVRLVTPDLAFLRTLLEPPYSPQVTEYIAYSREAHRIEGPAGSGVHVFNHFMRAWGHQFIYDQAALFDLLRDTGFHNVVARTLNDSPHDALRGLAMTSRMPPGFLAMESLVVEAEKA
jgi:predicted SAM-dependent methyltransferase